MSLRGGKRRKPEVTVEEEESSSNYDGFAGNDENSSLQEFSISSHQSRIEELEKDDHSEFFRHHLTRDDTRAVFHLKLLVLSILLLATVLVSYVCFRYTKWAEIDEFESQFEGAAEKVITSFEGLIGQIGTISSVGVASVSQGIDRIDEGINWPFVTLSSFEQRASTARKLSGAIYISLSPIIVDRNRDDWEQYAAGADSIWIEDGLQYQESLGLVGFEDNVPEDARQNDANFTSNTPDQSTGATSRISIYFYNEDGTYLIDPGPGPYLPKWQSSPVLLKDRVNENLLRRTDLAPQFLRCIEEKTVVLSGFETAPPGNISHPNTTTAFFATLRSFAEGQQLSYLGDPLSRLYIPIFQDDVKNNRRKLVAIMMVVLDWKSYFQNVVSRNVRGIDAVLRNSCDGTYTYRIEGNEVFPKGYGDNHEKRFEHMNFYRALDGNYSISDGTRFGLRMIRGDCYFSINVYPSQEFYDTYISSTPFAITFSVAFVFVFTTLMFLVYDRLVERRQRTILTKAAQSSAIVSSLFPKGVQDQLMSTQLRTEEAERLSRDTDPTQQLKAFLLGKSSARDTEYQNRQGRLDNDRQIADSYPHCTVFFADISGFTAWSSTREPEQVFILLQTVYQAFDLIAKRRRVFKVETIGDSYVAVTGLPDPQPEHALIMVKFAVECRKKFNRLSTELEVRLGPDTGDLSLRFGLHSGPVTAGVLRGEKARFQLFGDTVNTAARMESTGVPNQIQVSATTANLLIAAGKEHWVTARSDKVRAKGKGIMQTYFVAVNGHTDLMNFTYAHLDLSGDLAAKQEAIVKQDRLVEWMVDLLLERIKKLVAKRRACGSVSTPTTSDVVYLPPPGSSCLDEVKEIIPLDQYDPDPVLEEMQYKSLKISNEIVQQLRDYVSIVAMTYRNNPFHNFEHACHVTMSVNKLLKRIVTSEESLSSSQLHDFTQGIYSDTLAHFAIVFSALIHDADHRGVSNAQLIKEEEKMAALYKNKSVAEQNSLDISWDLLMSKKYSELRKLIFATEEELRRFRQIIVNVVLATDIFDKELNDLRKARWYNAFSDFNASTEDNAGVKATIVIEHIIQASDVSHTMQHWHIFCKWNARFFREMYLGYCQGRVGADPTKFWYKGELGFFDNYVIPLAKKLKECNIFGVSSEEFLSYAESNRAEWSERGQEIVQQMVDEIVPDVQHELSLHSQQHRE